MTRNLYLKSKFILSTFRVKIYLVSRNLYLKSKFILSTFRSLPLSNYPSVTKKKIHCIVKACSAFAAEWNWQLRGVFVSIAEQKNNYIN